MPRQYLKSINSMSHLSNTQFTEVKAIYDHYKAKINPDAFKIRQQENFPFIFGPEKSTGNYCIMLQRHFKIQEDVFNIQEGRPQLSEQGIPLKFTEVNFLCKKYPTISVHIGGVYGLVKITAGSAFALLPLFWTVIHEAGFDFTAKSAGATIATMVAYCTLVYGVLYTAMSKKDPIAYPPMEKKSLFKVGLEIAAALIVALCGLTLTADEEPWLSSFYTSGLYATFEIILLGLNHGTTLFTYFSAGDLGHYVTKFFSEMTNLTVLVGFYKMIQAEIAKIPLGTWPQLVVGAGINLAYFALFFKYVQPSINDAFKKIADGIYYSYSYLFPSSSSGLESSEATPLLGSVT